jgi:hypothetical protein
MLSGTPNDRVSLTRANEQRIDPGDRLMSLMWEA